MSIEERQQVITHNCRIERDYYKTWDTKAVRMLSPHLRSGLSFVEPWVGSSHFFSKIIRFFR